MRGINSTQVRCTARSHVSTEPYAHTDPAIKDRLSPANRDTTRPSARSA